MELEPNPRAPLYKRRCPSPPCSHTINIPPLTILLPLFLFWLLFLSNPRHIHWKITNKVYRRWVKSLKKPSFQQPLIYRMRFQWIFLPIFFGKNWIFDFPYYFCDFYEVFWALLSIGLGPMVVLLCIVFSATIIWWSKALLAWGRSWFKNPLFSQMRKEKGKKRKVNFLSFLSFSIVSI